MRIELTRAGLLVYLANHYTTRGALHHQRCPGYISRWLHIFVLIIQNSCYMFDGKPISTSWKNDFLHFYRVLRARIPRRRKCFAIFFCVLFYGWSSFSHGWLKFGLSLYNVTSTATAKASGTSELCHSLPKYQNSHHHINQTEHNNKTLSFPEDSVKF